MRLKTMDVQFTITFDYQRFYAESEFSGSDSMPRNSLSKAPTVEGAIVLTSENQPTIQIVDELLPWIQNLCFRAVATLANGEPCRVPYYSRSGYLELKPVDNVVEVSGNKTESAVYPKRELLQELFACGKRFDSMMREIKGSDKTVIRNLDYMKRFSAINQAALQ